MNLYSHISDKNEDLIFKFRLFKGWYILLLEERIPRIAKNKISSLLKILFLWLNQKLSADDRYLKIVMQPKVFLLTIVLSLLFSTVLSQKTDTLAISSPGQALQIAISNNLTIRAGDLKIKKYEVLQKTALDLPYTSFYFENEEFGHHNTGIRSIGISQSMLFPVVYKKRKLLFAEQTKLQETQNNRSRNEVTLEINSAWYGLQVALLRKQWRERLNSFYSNFLSAAKLRFETGETNRLEYMAAKEEWNKTQLLLSKINTEIQQFEFSLTAVINPGQPTTFPASQNIKANPSFQNANDTSLFGTNPLNLVLDQEIQVVQKKMELEKSRLLPTIEGGYALQNINRQPGFNSFQIGLGIPLFSKSGKSRVQALQMETDIRRTELNQKKIQFLAYYQQLFVMFNETLSQLNFYETEGLALSEDRMKGAQLAFSKGEIAYMEFIQNIKSASGLQESYFDTLDQYNQLIIKIQSLLGNQNL